MHHYQPEKTSPFHTLKRSEIAKLGESLTASWANSAGWKTLYQGLRHVGFELDVVIHKNNIVRILEVKSLRDANFVPDLERTIEFMNPRKAEAIRRGANFLVKLLSTQNIPLEQISCELVIMNFRPPNAIIAYRWPDACPLY